jgi:hypothetical protein
MIVIYILLALWVFWIFFLAVMSLYRAHLNKTISKTALILGYPVLVLGACIDFTMNFTLFSLIFLELPKEYMLTKRMQRYIATDTGWRVKLSKFICNNLLNNFDASGKHC